MKHLKSTLLTLAALLCSTVASAYDFKVDGIFYNITNSYDELTVEVTYENDINGIYNSYSGDVVIPATVTYDDKVYKVTSIGSYAFRNCSSLASITIPEGMTLIGYGAFSDCSSLASITIPEGVISIGYEAFEGCSSLTSIILPEGVTSIGSYAFRDCSSLASIILPEGVTSIGYSTFEGCSSLASINIPASVTNIRGAFWNCTSLTEIHIASIESWLKIRFDGESAHPNAYASNVKLYIDGEELTEVEVPSSVTSIPSHAFCNCSSLISITLPEGVTSIGSNAFRNCSSLASVAIAEDSKLTSIGSEAFMDCSSLASITIPEGVTKIENNTFRNCSSLASVAIPASVTSIGSEAFMDCSSLTSITIPEGVTKIENNTFRNCSSLASVAIPEGVTSIGSEAFMDCSSLTSITIPESVTSIESSAFSGCSSLTSITIPESVTSIGDYAFSGCSGLNELIIEDGDKDLVLGTISGSVVAGFGYGFRTGAFYELPLESVYLGRNLNGVESNISHFGYCKELKSVEIGNIVTNIPKFTFYACSNLAEIHIGSIDSWLKINYSDAYSHPNYSGKDVKLYLDGELITDVEIPSTVTSVPSYAFYNCDLASITIPNSVTSIGDYAIPSIKELILNPTTPPTLTSLLSLPDYAVIAVPKEAYSDYSTATYWADLLAHITIDDANARVKNLTLTADENESALQIAIGEEEVKYVTDLTISGTINSYDFMILRNKMPVLRYLNLENATIVANAYEHYTGHNTQDNKFPGYGLYNCKLFSLTFPKNITSVGNHSVCNNTYLSEVTLFEGVTTIDGDAFGECDALTAITLPKSLTTIEYGAFHRCDRLASVTFLDGLTSIGNDAFVDCGALESVVLPPTVKTIGYSAFRSCHSLKEIRIPSSIRSVGDGAFQGCDNLNDVYVYTVEPISIGQNTFAKNGNSFKGTLHAPKVSYKDYYYNTQWSQFTSFAEFDEPYENFYLVGDKVLDDNTGAIEGEEDDAPDAEMGNNSGLVVEDDIEQDLGDVDVNHDGENGGSIIVGDEGCVNADELHVHINVQGGRWYFFCFPFDLKKENISFDDENTQYVFRCYDGTKRAEGNSGWKNVTEEKGKYLKAAEGYIFQCSQDDVLTISLANVKFKKEDKYNELVAHAAANMQDASWNFVGNPYLSYYDMEALGYDAPITIWNGYTYEAIKPGDDDYQLAPFEAFFVQKPENSDAIEYDGDEQTTYNGAQKRAETARARRRTQAINPERLLVNITISNGENTDRTRIVFNNNVSMGYELACDAAKFEAAGVPQIYTLDGRAVKYAINERPVAEGIVTVGYSVPVQGNYTLAAPRMDTPISIKDNLTGTIHDFAEGSYEFASEAGTFEDRFTVIMKAGETSIDKLESTDNGQQSTVIYDAAGRRVEKMEQGIYIKDNRKVVIK